MKSPLVVLLSAILILGHATIGGAQAPNSGGQASIPSVPSELTDIKQLNASEWKGPWSMRHPQGGQVLSGDLTVKVGEGGPKIKTTGTNLPGEGIWGNIAFKLKAKNKIEFRGPGPEVGKDFTGTLTYTNQGKILRGEGWYGNDGPVSIVLERQSL